MMIEWQLLTTQTVTVIKAIQKDDYNKRDDIVVTMEQLPFKN